MNQCSDVLIAGGGVVGLMSAVLLARIGCRVTLIDARAQANEWQREHHDVRVVALTRASQDLLNSVGAWESMVLRRVSDYTGMSVWDGAGSGAIEFDAADLLFDNLGHIVELSVIETALTSVLQRDANVHILRGRKALQYSQSDEAISLQLDDGSSWSASLLIACDGAQSELRKQSGINVNEQPYEHHALIAQLRCETPHNKVARQRFTEYGPLAFLPLQHAHECSIVWSQTPAETQRVLALSDSAFEEQLAEAFEQRLGRLQLQSQRMSFPLVRRHASQYLQQRLVLLGDAAHTMHPLAGQGLNVSMMDAKTLVETIAQARQRGLDVGSKAALRPYERARYYENSKMLTLVGGLKTLFESKTMAAVIARNIGLSFCNQHAYLKREIVIRAMGLK